MEKLPPHEELKRKVLDKFTANSTYLGSFVKKTIIETDFKVLKEVTYPPTQIKKGDVIVMAQGSKNRPCVVVKILKDATVMFIPLTSTDNVHCLAPYNSRFFGEGCFSKAFDVCTHEKAVKNFVGVFDNNKDLNIAIKELKQYINKI